MTKVEEWLLKIEPGKWFAVTEAQVEILKPLSQKYDLTFSNDFTKVQKGYPDEYWKKTYEK